MMIKGPRKINNLQDKNKMAVHISVDRAVKNLYGTVSEIH